jgi:hypothetical protein
MRAFLRHHHHPSTTTTSTLPTYSFFPLSLGRTGVCVPLVGTLAEQAITSCVQLVPTLRHYSAFGRRLYSPNPNVVWRRALSICCHCTRQNPLRRESRVLNVSGVANVGIAVAVALRTENRDTVEKYLLVTGRSSRRLIRN